jgi:hypothetical protein
MPKLYDNSKAYIYRIALQMSTVDLHSLSGLLKIKYEDFGQFQAGKGTEELY